MAHETAGAIVAQDLSKTYGGGKSGVTGVRALDGLSFSVQSGTVYALLGPNGAGKTTTVRILTTLSKPDAGSASIAGIDVLTRPDRVRS
ncbi:MAG TPA: ATP-binding cassette domain-containing protein, partial [Streptosporangiaceae bacterium]|nr:ATP-binding cassette domain-containing protein [Streptosporangiaceae bacterium]